MVRVHIHQIMQHHISEDCNLQPGSDLQLIMLVTGLLQRTAILERKITQKQRYCMNIIIVRFEVLTTVYMKINPNPSNVEYRVSS